MLPAVAQGLLVIQVPKLARHDLAASDVADAFLTFEYANPDMRGHLGVIGLANPSGHRTAHARISVFGSIKSERDDGSMPHSVRATCTQSSKNLWKAASSSFAKLMDFGALI